MKTLKHIISKEEELPTSSVDLVEPIETSESVSRRLMCIVTAFELLSGQGASFLVIDVTLSDCHFDHRRSTGHRLVRIHCNVVCQSHDSDTCKRGDRIYQVR